ncbi:MAG TPA: ferredoxin reductase [Candidatus Dormibacteraeota bacterium]
MGRLTWQTATVVGARWETARVRSLVLDPGGWPGHRAGQHVDVRLTAEDGYAAQRSYSIASPPGEPTVTLTVERLDDGEVSPYLVDEVVPGDRFELRGPIGGHFVWCPEDAAPLQLLAGGSGVVPLMAMLRTRAGVPSPPPALLLSSSRTADDIIYRDELAALARRRDGLRMVHTLTRSAPPGWEGRSGRFDAAALAALALPPSIRPLTYVCGPTAFVESMAGLLTGLGHAAGRVRTERFGATGG